MELGLKNKRVVITGATQGIGRGITEAFAQEACRVAICARNQERLDQVAVAIKPQAAQVLAVSTDMTVPDEIERFARQVLDEFGGVDVLINCVGGVEKLLMFDDLRDEDWQELWDLNVMSAVRMTRQLLPAMRAQRAGRIVNICSESGVQPDPFMPHYNCVKAALLNFTKSLSKAEACNGVLVNAVSPAMTRNAVVDGLFEARAKADGTSLEEATSTLMQQMRPNMLLGRPGEPAEVAAAVVFMASEAASFITGSNLRVDAGSVATMPI
jgi:NAD(P)-dependent dehydrogenase (short-subunit alcohol dehydrogenase family)